MFIKNRLFPFLLLNILILLLYLICFQTNKSKLLIESNNNNYRFYLNGKLMDKIEDKSFSTGGISIYPQLLNLPFDTPIIPKIDLLEVKDLQGNLLFSKKNLATTGFQNWQDFKAEITISGVPNLAVTFHEQKNTDGITLVLRSFFDVDYGIKKKVAGVETIITGHTDLDIGLIQAISLLILLLLQSYPWMALLLGTVLIVKKITPRFIFLHKLKISQEIETIIFTLAVSLLILSAFLLLLYINLKLLEGVPHVPDSIIYQMQGKIFASGKLFAQPPIFRKYYDFFDSLHGGMLYHQGKWFSQYPFGHPLVLAVGEFFHLPWLIPPLISTLTLLLLYKILALFFAKKITLTLLVVLVLSPFFQSNGANFMSHFTALFFLTSFIFFYLRSFRHSSPVNPVLASLFYSLFFNTRILTAFAVLIPFGLFAVLNIKNLKKLLYFLPGGLIGLLLYFGYNWALTGKPGLNPYQLTQTPPLGFSAEHSFGSALLDTITNTSIFLSFGLGWPQSMTLVFLMLSILIPPFKKYDLLFFSSFAAIIIAWLWFDGSYIMYGPRYYYELLPFVLLLTGSGIKKLGDFTNAPNLSFSLTLILIVVFSIRLVNGWFFAKEKLWEISDTPASISELKNFNNVHAKLLKEVKSQAIHNALIFSKPCEHWWCDAVPVSYNSPNFNTDIIWAKDLGKKNGSLIKAYPNRSYYHADYLTGTILPYRTQPETP